MIAVVLKPMNNLSFVPRRSEHSTLKHIDCLASSSSPLALLLMHTRGHAYAHLNARAGTCS